MPCRKICTVADSDQAITKALKEWGVIIEDGSFRFGRSNYDENNANEKFIQKIKAQVQVNIETRTTTTTVIASSTSSSDLKATTNVANIVVGIQLPAKLEHAIKVVFLEELKEYRDNSKQYKIRLESYNLKDNLEGVLDEKSLMWNPYYVKQEASSQVRVR